MKNRTPVAYAVAVWTGRRYVYFGGYVDDKQAITLYPSCARMYARIEDAEACCDFIDSTGLWEVVPMYERC